MRKYFNYYVKKVVSVKNLVTIEYLTLSSHFAYPEEVHTFHEFAYVDSGELLCKTDEGECLLQQGELFLIPPGTNHSYEAVNNQAATVFITCFSCKSDFIELLNGKSVLENELKKMIADIVQESKNAFRYPFNKKLELLEKPTFGSQQLIENRIEEILIRLIRNKIDQTSEIRFVMSSVEFENSLVNDIVTLLKQNLHGRLTLEEISDRTFYSKTYINNIFKKNIGFSIMQYYSQLKIKEAKRLLRENLSTQAIADRLNFESANYFTKVFKKYAGMTPSQYKKTTLQ